jgi:hypothetical protein
VKNDPSIPSNVALVANIETIRQVLAAIVSRVPPDEVALVEIALEQGTAAFSSAKAAETNLSDDHLRAHVNARNDFRTLVQQYRTVPSNTK